MLLRDPVEEEVATNPRRARRLRRAAWLGVSAALAVAGWFLADALRDEPEGARPSAAARAGATAAIERRTLVERESVDGKLGYAGSRTVVHREASDGGAGAGDSGSQAGSGDGSTGGGSSGDGSAGSGSGDSSGGGSRTVTWLAAAGSVVRPGGVLYRVDDDPVVLMDGSVPAYRRLATGVARGRDVRQLERNLVALGFGAGVTVDERFTAATAAAVKRWQRSLGVRRTGEVELGSVVFLPGRRRVGERKTTVGSTVADGGEVLATTTTRRVVEVELEVSKRGLVRVGDGVRVTLPDGSEVAGRVASLGRAARTKGGDSDDGDGGGGGGDSGDDEAVIDLSISLRSGRAAHRLDQAPVTVDIASRVERRALSVPVTALVARPGGGYAVEIVGRDGSRRTVPVETGFFADGYVAVSGRGIRAGMRVVVPE